MEDIQNNNSQKNLFDFSSDSNQINNTSFNKNNLNIIQDKINNSIGGNDKNKEEKKLKELSDNINFNNNNFINKSEINKDEGSNENNNILNFLYSNNYGKEKIMNQIIDENNYGNKENVINKRNNINEKLNDNFILK